MNMRDIHYKLERKQCRFDNAGFCHEPDSCNFFHSPSICEIYLETGTCWLRNCRQRHPKVCPYGERCFRGYQCRYLHFTNPCDRCNTFSPNIYYCEFCSKNFCEHCTIEKAHVENIYETKLVENPSNKEKPNCKRIHHNH